MRFHVMITVEFEAEYCRDALDDCSSLGNIRDDVLWRAALDLSDSLRRPTLKYCGARTGDSSATASVQDAQRRHGLGRNPRRRGNFVTMRRARTLPEMAAQPGPYKKALVGLVRLVRLV